MIAEMTSPGMSILVAADGRANEDVVYGAHAEQVVGIHHDSILSDTLPYREVAQSPSQYM